MNCSLGEVIECVKNIVDGVRCSICDKVEGERARLPCGHTTCDVCLTAGDGCTLCLTPSNTLNPPVIDEPLTRRANNACRLLNICQDTFNIDVFRSLRTSEKLRAEKELFPKCIQAPVTYFNKRKSLALKNNKENLGVPFYPGENISLSNSYKMKSSNYIQEWLNNSVTQSRKALGDLTVNHQTNKKENMIVKTLRSSVKQKKFKNKHVTSTPKKIRERFNSNNSYSLLDPSMSSSFNFKPYKTGQHNKINLKMDKPLMKGNENDESGIVLDDEPILIEDSQSQVLDKDALALQAVEAADKEANFTAVESLELSRTLSPAVCNNPEGVNSIKNVPFYKRSSFLDSCYYEINDTSEINDVNDISVTIENNTFVTTINISKVAEINTTKNSVHIQTDICDISIPHENDTAKSKLPSDINIDLQNQEMQMSVIKNNAKRVISPDILECYEDTQNKRKGVVIDDSDSDVSSSFEVSLVHTTADVHRSCEPPDYGILEEIHTKKLKCRPLKRLRGATPDSNNSSDKENCDPNKKKKCKNSKKLKPKHK